MPGCRCTSWCPSCIRGISAVHRNTSELPALVLVALALTFGRPRREIVFWATLGVLALILAFGGNTFLYSLFYLLGPGFKIVRQQERAFLVFAMSAAVLAGYGTAALMVSRPRVQRARFDGFRRRLWLVFGVAIALAFLLYFGWVGGEHRDLFGGVLRQHVFGLLLMGGCLLLLAWRSSGWLRRNWAMGLLAGWIAFNGFSVNWRFNLEQPSGQGTFAATPVTTFLQQRRASTPKPFRIASGGLLPGGSGAASVYGLRDITGNTPLHLAAWEQLEAIVPEWRRWQLLNVRYVVSDRDVSGPGLTQVFSRPPRRPPRLTPRSNRRSPSSRWGIHSRVPGWCMSGKSCPTRPPRWRAWPRIVSTCARPPSWTGNPV